MGFSFNSSNLTREYISVKTASEISGYNTQYFRRLLREKSLKSLKLGQIWLIDRVDFMRYLLSAKNSKDKRFGPN